MSGFIGAPTMQDIERLERRIAALEQAFTTHGHTYAAYYGPGGEWDRTTGPFDAKVET